MPRNKIDTRILTKLRNIRNDGNGGFMYKKAVFTTGEVANLLHIHQTTVIDWVDKRLLTSYRTPGGHRRISREALFIFLERHEMPVPNVLIGPVNTVVETEKHRHNREDFQMNPHSQSKPMEAFPPYPKTGGVKNGVRKTKLATKHR